MADQVARRVCPGGGHPHRVNRLLLHLIPAADWAAARSRGTLAPSGDGFVHLSTAEQAQLPADRLFAGRTDLLVLAVDPAGLDVRFEPGRRRRVRRRVNSGEPGGRLARACPISQGRSGARR